MEQKCYIHTLANMRGDWEKTADLFDAAGPHVRVLLSRNGPRLHPVAPQESGQSEPCSGVLVLIKDAIC